MIGVEAQFVAHWRLYSELPWRQSMEDPSFPVFPYPDENGHYRFSSLVAAQQAAARAVAGSGPRSPKGIAIHRFDPSPGGGPIWRRTVVQGVGGFKIDEPLEYVNESVPCPRCGGDGVADASSWRPLSEIVDEAVPVDSDVVAFGEPGSELDVGAWRNEHTYHAAYDKALRK